MEILLNNACDGKSKSQGGLNLPEFKDKLKSLYHQFGINKDIEIDKEFRYNLKKYCDEIIQLLRTRQQQLAQPATVQPAAQPAAQKPATVQKPVPSVFRGKHIVNYQDNIYDGIWTDEKTGSGTIKYKNGDLFKGKWVNMKKVKGTFTIYPQSKTIDKIEYIGKWDGITGEGKILYYDYENVISTYVGQWKGLSYFGKGKLTIHAYTDGASNDTDSDSDADSNSDDSNSGDGAVEHREKIFTGIWKNNKDGYGTIDGDYHKFFNGSWENLLFKKGTYRDELATYDATWEYDANGSICHGIIRYVNGNTFEGTWRYESHRFKRIKGKFNCKTVSNKCPKYDIKRTLNLTVPYIMEGTFGDNVNIIFDCKFGKVYTKIIQDDYDTYVFFCKVEYKDGNVYNGYLLNSKPYGYGKMIYKDGNIYEGEWDKKGKMSGHGIMNYKDGNKYIGSWSNSKRHGYGKMIYADGRKEVIGKWKNNLLDNSAGIGSHFDTLPIEILWNIFSYMDLSSLFELSKLSDRLKLIVHNYIEDPDNIPNLNIKMLNQFNRLTDLDKKNILSIMDRNTIRYEPREIYLIIKNNIILDYRLDIMTDVIYNYDGTLLPIRKNQRENKPIYYKYGILCDNNGNYLVGGGTFVHH